MISYIYSNIWYITAWCLNPYVVCMVKSRDLCLLFQKRASFPNLFIVLNYICTNLEFSLWVCCLCFFSVQFLFITELVSHCFNYCSIIICFEMCSPLIILFFFLAFTWLFLYIFFFQMYFTINSSTSMKQTKKFLKVPWNFWVMCQEWTSLQYRALHLSCIQAWY